MKQTGTRINKNMSDPTYEPDADSQAQAESSSPVVVLDEDDERWETRKQRDRVVLYLLLYLAESIGKTVVENVLVFQVTCI